MSADDVLAALLKSQSREKKSSSKDDEESPYFFVEDSFLTEDIKVSVENVGNLEFPLTEETVKNVIKQSNKAKFGKGEKTILDTSVRDTQMIPGEKLKVEIKPEVLSAVLSRMAKDLNVDPNSRLIPHLYNMLIYERGQFFKEHKDSEKVNNMIATLVVLLPSPHEGGELIIKHQGKKCKFSGSSNHKIVQCVAFYSDCTHEVLKVTQGYRVALTYNIELNFSNDPKSSDPVNPEIKKALSDYFADKKFEFNPKFVYYLNHLYSKKSLNWSMLKGTDRNEALALHVAANELGYVPSLALIVYHRTIDVGQYGNNDDEVDAETELKMLVDYKNVKYKFKLGYGDISVDDSETCCSVDTEDLIEPEKSELEGWTGNEGQMQDLWYTRAAVVIFKSKWCYPIGFRTHLKLLHDLTLKPGNQAELIKKFDENSDEFLHNDLLNHECKADKEESEVINMLLDMALYMNDKKRAVKIISEFSSKKTLKLVKIPKLMKIFDRVLEPTSWTKIIPAWKVKSYNESAKPILQTYVSSYMEKHPNDYNVQVVEYLLSEIIGLLKNKEKDCGYGNLSSITKEDFQEELKYILQKLDDLKNERLEETLSLKLRQRLLAQKAVVTKEHFNVLQQILTPKQFSRVGGVYLEHVIMEALKDIETKRETTYTYLIDPDGDKVEKFCALFQNFTNIQDPQLRVKILARMESKPDIYTGVLITGAIDKLKNVCWSQNRDLSNICLKIINKQLASSEGTINWSLVPGHMCCCDFCLKVKTFLLSASSKKQTFLISEKMKEHVLRCFKPPPTCPITNQLVKSENHFNFIVEKTSRVVSDHQNFIAYLRAGRDKVMQIIQNLSVREAADNPPPCKVQKR